MRHICVSEVNKQLLNHLWHSGFLYVRGYYLFLFMPFQDGKLAIGAGDQWQVFQRSQDRWEFTLNKTDSRFISITGVPSQYHMSRFYREELYPGLLFFRYYGECFIPLRVHCSSLADFRHACQTALQKLVSILSTCLYSANCSMFAEEPYCEGWLWGLVPPMACGSLKEKGTSSSEVTLGETFL